MRGYFTWRDFLWHVIIGVFHDCLLINNWKALQPKIHRPNPRKIPIWVRYNRDRGDRGSVKDVLSVNSTCKCASTKFFQVPVKHIKSNCIAPSLCSSPNLLTSWTQHIKRTSRQQLSLNKLIHHANISSAMEDIRHLGSLWTNLLNFAPTCHMDRQLFLILDLIKLEAGTVEVPDKVSLLSHEATAIWHACFLSKILRILDSLSAGQLRKSLIDSQKPPSVRLLSLLQLV
jgi:hypothetical protein